MLSDLVVVNVASLSFFVANIISSVVRPIDASANAGTDTSAILAFMNADPQTRLDYRRKNEYLELGPFESHCESRDDNEPFRWGKHIIGHACSQARAAPRPDLAVIAVYGGHDASIAVSIGGRVQCALELERFFNVRYFGDQARPIISRYIEAVTAFKKHCECESVHESLATHPGLQPTNQPTNHEGKACPIHFDVGVILRGIGLDKMKPWAKAIKTAFSVKQWEAVDHNYAHALSAFYSSPFRSALVVSYDGGSEDGQFQVYHSVDNETSTIASLDYNLGSAYMSLSSILPEVTGNSINKMCDNYRRLPNDEKKYRSSLEQLLPTERMPRALSWAGKLMGYAATGKPDPELGVVVRQYLEKGMETDFNGSQDIMEFAIPIETIHSVCNSQRTEQAQRDLGATIQVEFQKMSYNIMEELLHLVRNRDVEGIVLTGGCALNVLANQAIYNGLVRKEKKINGMYVGPSPHDGGLTVGGLWAVMPPPTRGQPLQYTGFRLWDEDTLDAVAQQRGAKKLSTLGGVDYLAQLLAGKTLTKHTTDKPIIAVVRGRQEYGPRALGHRSILAVPDSDAIRGRMNKLKFRQWYRPVAPMFADEALVEAFGHEYKSQYMTMAPLVRADIRKSFPALAHLDGTARHQSVSSEDEPWIHALLTTVGKLTGLATLINTSFNTRGKPIVNTVKESMKMLDTLPDLDYVLIEDWLFEKSVDANKAARPKDDSPSKKRQEL